MSVETLKFYPSVSVSYFCCHFGDLISYRTHLVGVGTVKPYLQLWYNNNYDIVNNQSNFLTTVCRMTGKDLYKKVSFLKAPLKTACMHNERVIPLMLYVSQ
jgi:hypothetical protein